MAGSKFTFQLNGLFEDGRFIGSPEWFPQVHIQSTTRKEDGALFVTSFEYHNEMHDVRGYVEAKVIEGSKRYWVYTMYGQKTPVLIFLRDEVEDIWIFLGGEG